MTNLEYPWGWEKGPMTAGQAHYELDRLGFCGCGRPEDALQMIFDVLECYSNENYCGEATHGDYKKIEERLPDSGTKYFILYQLANMGLTEHGGGVPGWLTSRGVAFRGAVWLHGAEKIACGMLDLDTGKLIPEGGEDED